MCTYDGQQYLSEQLESIAAQSHPSWSVWVSDDGSTDATPSILEDYKKQWGAEKLATLAGPKRGFARNFLSLTCNQAIQADYYAYADQDDIWEADKLERALRWLASVPADVPALYCSRTRLVGEQGDPLGFSPLFQKPPSFENALVQSIAGGNTMVFNHAARKLLTQAGDSIDLVTHDWWAYMVVSGCGGRVFYDDYPSLRYRQHGGNLVGSNSSWADRLVRIGMLFKGRFKTWNDQNIECLQKMRPFLTPQNRQLLDRFSTSRSKSLLPRLFGIMRTGVYRQTLLGNIGLVIAIMTRKI